MEMKGDKSHDRDHWVKQEQNHGAVYFGRVGSTKEGWNLYSSLCRLLINSHSEDDSLRIPLVHICVILYLQIMLFCCSADQRLQLLPYFFIALASSTWHTKVQPHSVLFDHVSTHYHHLSILARHRTHSKYARSHNYCRRLWWKTICLCFPMS